MNPYDKRMILIQLLQIKSKSPLFVTEHLQSYLEL
jgi:hypothetical protein